MLGQVVAENLCYMVTYLGVVRRGVDDFEVSPHEV